MFSFCLIMEVKKPRHALHRAMKKLCSSARSTIFSSRCCFCFWVLPYYLFIKPTCQAKSPLFERYAIHYGKDISPKVSATKDTPNPEERSIGMSFWRANKSNSQQGEPNKSACDRQIKQGE